MDSPQYYGYGPYQTEPQSYWSPPTQAPHYVGPPPSHVHPPVNTGNGSPQGFVGGFMMPSSTPTSQMSGPAYNQSYTAGGYAQHLPTHSPAGSYSSERGSSVRSGSSYYDSDTVPAAAGYESRSPPSPIYATGSSEVASPGRTNTTGHSHQTSSTGVKDGRRHRMWNKVAHLSEAASKLVADL